MSSPYGPTRAVQAFWAGLKFGYPLCCVANYTLDVLLGIPPGISRGDKYDPKLGTYVPCHHHKRVSRTLSRSDATELINSGFSVEHLAPEDNIETRINGRIVSAIKIPSGTDAIFLSQIKLQDSD